MIVKSILLCHLIDDDYRAVETLSQLFLIGKGELSLELSLMILLLSMQYSEQLRLASHQLPILLSECINKLTIVSSSIVN